MTDGYTEQLHPYWDDPITQQEAADYLHTTVAALATKRCKERGPAYIKDGKFVRYMFPVSAHGTY